MAQPPDRPKIYHILHIDNLGSIVADGRLSCDAEMQRRGPIGTTIGVTKIKERRLSLPVTSRPGLFVGACVPFYFCPRSVMLFVLHRGNNTDLTYHAGQEPIVHLEADLLSAVDWAEQHGRRWAFTLSNAGANYFEDRSDLNQLQEIDWDAVAARQWSGRGVPSTVKEGKQAEFLLEGSFPWELVERVGVKSQGMVQRVFQTIGAAPPPRVEIQADWYY